MAVKPILPGLYEIRLGYVNAFLIEAEDSLTLVDTGVAASAEAIVSAIRAIGRQPADLRHILVTHCHADHAGSLAALKRLTNATASMHGADAELVRAGECLRPVVPGPGMFNRLMFRLLVRSAPRSIEPAEVEHELADADELPIAGGIKIIHAPGHCAGQVCLLWRRHGGVLFAADAAANALGLAMSPAYEDVELGRRSLAKLAALDFEAACFGHGRAIRRGASRQFRRKWAAAGDKGQAAA